MNPNVELFQPKAEEEVVKDVVEGMGCNMTDPPTTIGDFYDRLRYDGSLGKRPVRLSQDVIKKREAKRKKKQRSAKAARKRNRR